MQDILDNLLKDYDVLRKFSIFLKEKISQMDKLEDLVTFDFKNLIEEFLNNYKKEEQIDILKNLLTHFLLENIKNDVYQIIRIENDDVYVRYLLANIKPEYKGKTREVVMSFDELEQGKIWEWFKDGWIVVINKEVIKDESIKKLRGGLNNGTS